MRISAGTTFPSSEPTWTSDELLDADSAFLIDSWEFRCSTERAGIHARASYRLCLQWHRVAVSPQPHEDARRSLRSSHCPTIAWKSAGQLLNVCSNAGYEFLWTVELLVRFYWRCSKGRQGASASASASAGKTRVSSTNPPGRRCLDVERGLSTPTGRE